HRLGVEVDAIERIDVGLGRVNWLMVGGEFNPNASNPVVHAQFNLAYCLAEAIRFGEVGIGSFDPRTVREGDVRLISRIRCFESPEIEANSVGDVVVELTMRDGSRMSFRKDARDSDRARIS